MTQKRCTVRIKKLDIFGKRVYLTHDSEEMFKTPTGGIASVLFFIGLLSYGLSLSSNVWYEKIQSI